TEFLNQTLHAYFAAEGIHHQTSVARTSEQNGVVERRNRTLVEAARTMLSAAKVPLFFWAERTRVIMESIHVNFNELPEMASAHNSSDPALTRQEQVSVHNSTDPGPSRQAKASVQISYDPAPECQTMALEHNSLSPGQPHAENDQVADDEFINIFSTPVQD
nr:putative ribonuclease H-like domain-containing protein [Tanacetum cinerariifolium]